MAGVPERKAPILVDNRGVRATVDSGHCILWIGSIFGLHVQKRLVAVAKPVFRGTHTAVHATHAFKLKSTLGDEAPITQTRVKAACID